MARPRIYWWRFYCEMLRDPKIRLRPVSDRWAWCAVLTVARESPEPGYLIVIDEVMTIAALADLAAVTTKEAKSAYDYFIRTGMVELDHRGIPFATAFLERQYESDTSTERTGKHRSKDVPKNGSNSDLGTESSSVSLNSVSLSSEKSGENFDRFWDVYPRHEAKGAARKAFDKALNRADLDVILAGAARLRDDPNRDPAFTPHPTTWLNQDRWEDDALPARHENPASRAGDRTAKRVEARIARVTRPAPARAQLPQGETP